MEPDLPYIRSLVGDDLLKQHNDWRRFLKYFQRFTFLTQHVEENARAALDVLELGDMICCPPVGTPTEDSLAVQAKIARDYDAQHDPDLKTLDHRFWETTFLFPPGIGRSTRVRDQWSDLVWFILYYLGREDPWYKKRVRAQRNLVFRTARTVAWLWDSSQLDGRWRARAFLIKIHYRMYRPIMEINGDWLEQVAYAENTRQWLQDYEYIGDLCYVYVARPITFWQEVWHALLV